MKSAFAIRLAGALLVAFLVGSCGGGGGGGGGGDDSDAPSIPDLSTDDYFKALERLGQRADEEIADAETVGEYLEVISVYTDDVAAINVPADVEREHEDFADAAAQVVEEVEDIAAEDEDLTLEDLADDEPPGLTAAKEDADAACRVLQEIADDEEADVDLDCGEEGGAEETPDESATPDESETPGETETPGFETPEGDDDGPSSDVPNDDIGDAIQIDSIPFDDELDTSGATADSGDPESACGTAGAATVWYSVELDDSLGVVISTAGSDFDTVVAVFEEAGGDLAEITCDDDGGEGATSQVLADLEAGTTYLIGVTGYEDASGLLVIELSEVSGNDLLGSATEITSLPFTDSINVSGFTTGADDPSASCAPGQNSQSAWYVYTASAAGNVAVSTVGSDYDTVLTVYAGIPEDASKIACNDDPLEGGSQATLSFTAAAGMTYYIEVAEYGSPSETGSLVLTVQ